MTSCCCDKLQQGPVSSVVSPGGQTVQAGSIYGSLPQQLSASAPAYHSPYPLVSTLAGPSSSSQKEQNFPENPGQPECQFYMRTGDCKFGQTCRYHHPPEWSIPKTTCALSPIGLPLRPVCFVFSITYHLLCEIIELTVFQHWLCHKLFIPCHVVLSRVLHHAFFMHNMEYANLAQHASLIIQWKCCEMSHLRRTLLLLTLLEWLCQSCLLPHLPQP